MPSGLNLFQNAQEIVAGDTSQLHLGDRDVVLKKAEILHEKGREKLETLTSAILKADEQPGANTGALGCLKKGDSTYTCSYSCVCSWDPRSKLNEFDKD